METLTMRELLPDRRRSWTQRVRIGEQTCYLNVGEYDDGRPGEVFIDVSKQGTFLRGIMNSLARTISIALQCGADIKMIIHALKGVDFPPGGMVHGSPHVTDCCSVTDWIAQELQARYVSEDDIDTDAPLEYSSSSSLIDDEDEDEEDEEFEDNVPYAFIPGNFHRGSGH